MAKIHHRDFIVRWSEQDANARFGPEHYLRYLIETAYDWGDSLGLGQKAYDELGIYWLIRETELIVEKFPQHNDELTLTIWMNQWQRVRGTRSYRVTKKDTGELYAYGAQKIVVMDVETLRPKKIDEEVIGRFKIDDPDNNETKDRLRQQTGPLLLEKQRVVNWSDLDAQQHVNNVVYVNYARDLLNEFQDSIDPASVSTATRYIHIEYSSPALWKERLTLGLHEDGSDDALRYYRVRASREDGSLVMECVIGVEL